MQSAYRRGHSTETALLKVYNDLVFAADNGMNSFLALLDLSSAFDDKSFILLHFILLHFTAATPHFLWSE